MNRSAFAVIGFLSAAAAFAQGTGQANSLDASLAVNAGLNPSGHSATPGIPGPFYTAASVGSPVMVTIQGQPTQPWILMTGALNPGNWSIPGVGSLDIGALGPGNTTDLTVQLDGTQPGPVNAIAHTNAAGLSLLAYILGTLPTGVWLSGQAAVLTPFSAGGVVLTAATQFRIEPPTTTLFLGDELTHSFSLSAFGMSMPFFGTTQNTVAICANGYLTFGTAISEFISSPTSFNGGPARISAFWCDLEQTFASTIRYTVNSAPPNGIPPYVRIEYIGVGDFLVQVPHTFTTYFDVTGYVALEFPTINPPSIFEQITGIGPGGGFSSAPMKDLSTLLASSPSSGGPLESFYEWFGDVTMPYYTLGVNRPHDLAGRTLNFVPSGAGSLPGSTDRYTMY